jgi:1-phosphatidylinositol-3-phosphate 5-kinase
MRFTFQRAEQALYSQLRDTPNSALNDVRREFHSAAQGTNRRLAAWEAKHLSKDARPRLVADREAVQQPHWWHPGFHAVPGGNVIVREEDWGSIIAFTLRYVGASCVCVGRRLNWFVHSSFDYQRELANLMNPRTLHASTISSQSTRPPMTSRQNTMSSLGRSTASNSTSSFKFFGSSQKPDPDREDSVWYEPEAYSAVVTRKEHPRDPTALLSLRDVLRHKVPVESPQSAQSSSIASVSRMTNNAMPPSAWAKPAVEVNMAAVDGHVTGMPEAVVTAGRILHELDGASVLTSKGSTDSVTSGFVETNVHRGNASSILSRVSLENLGGPSHAVPGEKSIPAPQRAATERANAAAGVPLTASPRSRSSTASTTQDSTTEAEAAANASANDSFILSWTSSLTNAMRYVLKADLSARPATPPAKNHHGLLFADPLGTIDERPHVKYDWTIGRRLRFSCTVYYAKQFEALRRRCGVEDVFVKSMAKCEPWKAQGGKSRSNFWKTADDRFIIKTLVNAWNVADLCVLYPFLFMTGRLLTSCKKPSSHRFSAVLFPAYGFDREPGVDPREAAWLLYCRSSQLGGGDRAGKGGSSRDGESVL